MSKNFLALLCSPYLLKSNNHRHNFFMKIPTKCKFQKACNNIKVSGDCLKCNVMYYLCQFLVLNYLSKMREKEPLECRRNAYLSIKNPKASMALKVGPGPRLLRAHFACTTPLRYVGNFWPQKLALFNFSIIFFASLRLAYYFFNMLLIHSSNWKIFQPRFAWHVISHLEILVSHILGY